MWRLWNKLFGWDYILWKTGIYNGIGRIHKEPAPLNRIYYTDMGVYMLDRPDQVIWLTCSSDKYFEDTGEIK